MGRILCFDYGLKRVGVAVTDELKIISTPYDTFPASNVFNLTSEYLSKIPLTYLLLVFLMT